MKRERIVERYDREGYDLLRRHDYGNVTLTGKSVPGRIYDMERRKPTCFLGKPVLLHVGFIFFLLLLRYMSCLRGNDEECQYDGKQRTRVIWEIDLIVRIALCEASSPCL